MDIYQVIKSPLVTEKALLSKEGASRYSFVVDKEATKTDVKKAVEALFKVDVVQVRTAIVRGKLKRVGRSLGKKPNWKKAIVDLKAEQKIEFFEGV